MSKLDELTRLSDTRLPSMKNLHPSLFKYIMIITFISCMDFVQSKESDDISFKVDQGHQSYTFHLDSTGLRFKGEVDLGIRSQPCIVMALKALKNQILKAQSTIHLGQESKMRYKELNSTTSNWLNIKVDSNFSRFLKELPSLIQDLKQREHFHCKSS